MSRWRIHRDARPLLGTMLWSSALLLCCAARGDSILPLYPAVTPFGSSIYRVQGQYLQYVPHAATPDMQIANSEHMLLSTISDIESRQGPYTPELVQPLRELGTLRFRLGDYAAAGSAFERAVRTIRINEGLRASAQIPAVESLIEARLADGQFQAADQEQRYLLSLQLAAHRPWDPELRVAVARYADWQRGAYLAGLGEAGFLRILELIDLQTGMARSIERELGEHSRALIPYLYGRLDAEYLLSLYPGESVASGAASARSPASAQGEQLRFVALRKWNFRNGERTVERILSVLAADPDAHPLELADAWLALADWQQWHARHAVSMGSYLSAWRLAGAAAGGESWLQKNFAEPLELPARIVFQQGRLAFGEEHGDDIEVRFDVTRQGRARRIDVLHGERGGAPAVADRTERMVQDMRFRPRIEDGVPVYTHDLVRAYRVRY